MLADSDHKSIDPLTPYQTNVLDGAENINEEPGNQLWEISEAIAYFSRGTNDDLVEALHHGSTLYQAWEDGGLSIHEIDPLSPVLKAFSHFLGSTAFQLGTYEEIKVFAESYRIGFLCEYAEQFRAFQQEYTPLPYNSWRNKIKRKNKENHTSYSSDRKVYGKYVSGMKAKKSEVFEETFNGYLSMTPFSLLLEGQLLDSNDPVLIKLLGSYGNLDQRDKAAKWFEDIQDRKAAALILSSPLELRFAENIDIRYGEQLAKAISFYCEMGEMDQSLETMQALSEVVEKRIHFKDNHDGFLDEAIPVLSEAAQKIRGHFQKEAAHKTALVTVLNILMETNIYKLVKKSTSATIDLSRDEISRQLDIPSDIGD